MTQASTYENLCVSLTPMRIPESLPASEINFSVEAQTTMALSSPHLLVCPGETSELVVHLESRAVRPLLVELAIEGNIPIDWYRIGTEGRQLEPRHKMEAVVNFRVPVDFFEAEEALGAGESLEINYQVRLTVHISELAGDSDQQVVYAPFRVSLRPQSLYLDFVPLVYREIDFIGRLLAIFEQAFEPVAQTLDAMWAYLDPLTAPQEMLPFLAHWVAWPLDERWEEAQLRRLVRHAVEIYRLRGTRPGLRLFLHLYTGLPLDEQATTEAKRHIAISEAVGSGFVLGSASLGRDSLFGGGRPFHFAVRLRSQFPDQVDPHLVRRIIEQEKPAHCTYDLTIELAEPMVTS
jgi:phage tail-like protein